MSWSGGSHMQMYLPRSQILQYQPNCTEDVSSYKACRMVSYMSKCQGKCVFSCHDPFKIPLSMLSFRSLIVRGWGGIKNLIQTFGNKTKKSDFLCSTRVYFITTNTELNAKHLWITTWNKSCTIYKCCWNRIIKQFIIVWVGVNSVRGNWQDFISGLMGAFL